MRALPLAVLAVGALLAGTAGAAPGAPKTQGGGNGLLDQDRHPRPAGRGNGGCHRAARRGRAGRQLHLPGRRLGRHDPGRLRERGSTDAGVRTADATGTSEVDALSLFGGEITATRLIVRALANATPDGSSGNSKSSAIEGLTVLGQPVTPAVNTTVPIGDWGTAVVLEAALDQSGPRGRTRRRRRSPRSTFNSRKHTAASRPAARSWSPTRRLLRGPKPPRRLRLHLLPAWPDQAPAASPAAHAAVPRTDQPPDARPRAQALAVRLTHDPARPQGPSDQADRRPIRLSRLRPVVVHRHVRRLPRATPGWHHGDDIFATLGSPVLAVAKGIVFSVGWNTSAATGCGSGRRGHEFYYAHLSAYSPLAVNGARVNAGDVLGFVGNTGDAAGTPYHLHFEIHPVSLLGSATTAPSIRPSTSWAGSTSATSASRVESRSRRSPQSARHRARRPSRGQCFSRSATSARRRTRPRRGQTGPCRWQGPRRRREPGGAARATREALGGSGGMLRAVGVRRSGPSVFRQALLAAAAAAAARGARRARRCRPVSLVREPGLRRRRSCPSATCGSRRPKSV